MLKRKTPAELYDEKVAELHKARAKLDDCAAREIKIRKRTTRDMEGRDLVPILEERREIEALIHRLEGESAEAYALIPRPPIEITEAQRIRLEATMPPAPDYRGGTASQLAEVRAEQRAAQREFDLARATGARNVIAKVEAKMRDIDLRIMALEGPPYPAYMPWASKADLLAMRQRLGLKK